MLELGKSAAAADKHVKQLEEHWYDTAKDLKDISLGVGKLEEKYAKVLALGIPFRLVAKIDELIAPLRRRRAGGRIALGWASRRGHDLAELSPEMR